MTYPSSLVDAFKQAVIRRIVGPKDRFERHKRYVLGAAFVLIGMVFAGPALLTGFVSSLEKAKVAHKNISVDIVGRASNDTLIFAIALVSVCVFSLGCNLYYGLHVQDSEKAVKDVAEELKNP